MQHLVLWPIWLGIASGWCGHLLSACSAGQRIWPNVAFLVEEKTQNQIASRLGFLAALLLLGFVKLTSPGIRRGMPAAAGLMQLSR